MSEFLLILTEYSSEFLLCEKRDILSGIPCLHTWLKDAGLIYKILRVSMKNYIDIAEKAKTDAMDAMEKALNGYNIALKINIIYENITSECSAKL